MFHMVPLCLGRGPERSMKGSMRDFKFIMNCTYLCLFSFPLFCTFFTFFFFGLLYLSRFVLLLFLCANLFPHKPLSLLLLVIVHTFSVHSSLTSSVLLSGATSVCHFFFHHLSFSFFCCLLLNL